MSIRMQLHATMTTLNYNVRQLNNALEQLLLVQARVHVLPPVPMDAEGKKVEPFTVNTIDGQDALIKAMAHFEGFHARENESRKIARRLPGFILLQGRPNDEVWKEIVMLKEQIKRQKNLFASLAKQLGPNEEARHERLHEEFPMLITLNVYRAIDVYDIPIESIHFSWVHKHSMQQMTQQEVIKRLENAQVFGSSRSILQDEFKDMVLMEMDKIASYPKNTVFTTRRPIRVAPVANIMPKVGVRHQVTAHSPVVMLAQSSKTLRSNDLSDYPGESHKTPEYYDLVIPRMHLYVKNK